MLHTWATLASEAEHAPVPVRGSAVACAVTLTRPVHRAALPGLAATPRELVAGNAASTTAEGLGAFLGPLACGLLITGGGPEAVLGLFGLLLLGAAASVAGLRTAGPAPRDRADTALRGALAGVHQLGRDRAAMVLLLMVAGQYVVVGAMDILLMVVAIDVLETGTSGPGFLASALGVGSV